MIAAYYKRLTSADGDTRRAAAREWTLWEMGTSKLIPDSSYIDKADNLDFAAAFAVTCLHLVALQNYRQSKLQVALKRGENCARPLSHAETP